MVLKWLSRQEKIFDHMLFQQYITNIKKMKLYFMFPLEVPKKLIWLIYITISLQSNMANMQKYLCIK